MTDAVVNIIIIDFVSGRRKGGHQEDYLSALERVFANRGARTIAPYRTHNPEKWLRLGRRLIRGRLGRFIYELMLIRRTLSKKEPTIAIIPNPDFRDYIVFGLAALFLRVASKGIAIFVLRREANVVAGSERRGQLLTWLFTSALRKGTAFPVSDSQDAMRWWTNVTGVEGPIVSIPERPLISRDRQPSAGPVFGLIGVFRAEKGAFQYGEIIEAVLAASPISTIVVQLSLSGATEEEHQLAAGLLQKWSNASRVRIVTGSLEEDQFTTLMNSIDVIILPYDTESYGSGTSGIMFEALCLDKLVIATRFRWGLSEYSVDGRVTWLKDLRRESLDQAVNLACASLAKKVEPNYASSGSKRDRFAESWRAAVSQAAESPRIRSN